MKAKTVLLYVGNGSLELTARRLGLKRSTVRRWPVDAAGNITSERLRDQILARLVRWRCELMRQKGEEDRKSVV